MLSIRNAHTKDIPLIRKLCFQIWPQTYADIISQEQIDYMLDLMYSETSLKKQMTEESCKFILIYDDSEPAGFASYGETEPSVYKLHKIYILPNQQGKGTGKFSIDYIITEIKKDKAKALQLQVNRRNKARYFYEKLGFTVIREFDFDIGSGFVMDDYLMELKLSN
jgi:GNAT superfamily N-acetyltransferase